MPKRENKDAAPVRQGGVWGILDEAANRLDPECREKCVAATAELMGHYPEVLKRIGWMLQGTYTPEQGMYDLMMLAGLQGRDPETIRRWAEANSVPLHKAGRANSYRGEDIVRAARVNGEVEDGT